MCVCTITNIFLVVSVTGVLENGQEKELTQDLPDMHSQFSSSVDVVEVNDHNNVPHVEDKDNENISEKNVDKHFIHTVDINKVDDDTEGDKEVIDGIVVSVEGVQEVDHGVAETAGEDEPTTSAPRDMATSFQFLHQAVSLKMRVSRCPNLHQHGNFCTVL